MSNKYIYIYIYIYYKREHVQVGDSSEASNFRLEIQKEGKQREREKSENTLEDPGNLKREGGALGADSSAVRRSAPLGFVSNQSKFTKGEKQNSSTPRETKKQTKKDNLEREEPERDQAEGGSPPHQEYQNNGGGYNLVGQCGITNGERRRRAS